MEELQTCLRECAELFKRFHHDKLTPQKTQCARNILTGIRDHNDQYLTASVDEYVQLKGEVDTINFFFRRNTELARLRDGKPALAKDDRKLLIPKLAVLKDACERRVWVEIEACQDTIHVLLDQTRELPARWVAPERLSGKEKSEALVFVKGLKLPDAMWDAMYAIGVQKDLDEYFQAFANRQFQEKLTTVTHSDQDNAGLFASSSSSSNGKLPFQ